MFNLYYYFIELKRLFKDPFFYIRIFIIFNILNMQTNNNFITKVSYLYIFFFNIILLLNYFNRTEMLGFFVFIELTSIFMYIVVTISFFNFNIKNSDKHYNLLLLFIAPVINEIEYYNFLNFFCNFINPDINITNNFSSLYFFLYVFNIVFFTSIIVFLFFIFFIILNFINIDKIKITKKSLFYKNINLIKQNNFTSTIFFFK